MPPNVAATSSHRHALRAMVGVGAPAAAVDLPIERTGGPHPTLSDSHIHELDRSASVRRCGRVSRWSQEFPRWGPPCPNASSCGGSGKGQARVGRPGSGQGMGPPPYSPWCGPCKWRSITALSLPISASSRALSSRCERSCANASHIPSLVHHYVSTRAHACG